MTGGFRAGCRYLACASDFGLDFSGGPGIEGRFKAIITGGIAPQGPSKRRATWHADPNGDRVADLISRAMEVRRVETPFHDVQPFRCAHPFGADGVCRTRRAVTNDDAETCTSCKGSAVERRGSGGGQAICAKTPALGRPRYFRQLHVQRRGEHALRAARRVRGQADRRRHARGNGEGDQERQRKALADAPYPGGGSRARGVAIAVPIHWFDSLDSVNHRPWFVIDPPDGKIPPLTDAAKKRLADAAEARGGAGPRIPTRTGASATAVSAAGYPGRHDDAELIRQLLPNYPDEGLRRHPVRDGRDPDHSDRRPRRLRARTSARRYALRWRLDRALGGRYAGRRHGQLPPPIRITAASNVECCIWSSGSSAWRRTW